MKVLFFLLCCLVLDAQGRTFPAQRVSIDQVLGTWAGCGEVLLSLGPEDGAGSGAGRGGRIREGGRGPQFSGSKGGGCWEWVNLRETPESPKIWKKVAWFPRAWKGHEDRVLGVGENGLGS